jgi:hypothetical protein
LVCRKTTSVPAGCAPCASPRRAAARGAGILSVGLLGLLTPAGAPAQTFEISGHAEIETRIFPNDPASSGQDGSTVSPSVALAPEFRYSWNDGRDRITAIPFGRLDADDDERTHADIRALNWTHRADDWDTVLGIAKVFWGVAESRHLVDVVNQVDLVENLDEEDRLGQPMANLNLYTDYGTFGLFVLPGFRERTFPDGDARMRGALPVIADDARFESGAAEHHVDFAARWRRTFGGVDLGVAHFHGTGREPRMIAEVRSGNAVFVPFYDQIDQSSVDAQLTTGDWLFKFEGIVRGGQGRTFAAAVGGFEYTITGIAGTRADLGLLAEYHYDGRDSDAPPTLFDRDVFVGARYTLNDPESTSLLAGAIVDQSDRTTLVSLEAERRIGESWKAEAELRLFLNVSPTDPILAGIARDDHLLLRLSRFF